MASKQWFIKLDEQNLGPMPSREIQLLAKQEVVTAETLLSTDGKTWRYASSVQGLQFGSPPSPKIAAEVQKPPKVELPAIWPDWTKYSPDVQQLFAIAVGLCLLVIVVLGLSSLFSGGGPKNQTLAYWNSLRSLTQQAVQESNRNDSQQTIQAHRRARDAIHALSTEDVDWEVIALGGDLAAAFDFSADTFERNAHPGKFVESVIRGYSGDPFGTFLQSLSEEDEARREFQAVSQKAIRVRAQMSARYGVDFPAF